ncbi:pleckstrin homology domain-containing family J member 1 isoform X2 [Delphinapterus leucas]|uniref:Pleckstrin homology domain-containing family J member 1 n=1 Tax=Delphinapterus leucas TaxID=9749 RepID=A0A2Y9M214_DELLE|nr:pleckstrin homology domain-containing family J member 1 isoform X2 [Delphinapterus leucas]XP_022413292.1 pleckstrin homology domain-containing family J member 1 isoform X2 [Delphinapterus leucas]
MRYNEKELQALSRQPAEMAAELGMRGPKKGSVVKRRLVKLVVNFLFYFRTDEAEPVGALLLEHCRVTQEEPSGFSISFLEDPERKYHFECCSEEQCQEWMAALRRASYEFMRRSLIFYRNEIQKMTGKDPLEQFGISEEARFQLSGLKGLPSGAGGASAGSDRPPQLGMAITARDPLCAPRPCRVTVGKKHCHQTRFK